MNTNDAVELVVHLIADEEPSNCTAMTSVKIIVSGFSNVIVPLGKHAEKSSTFPVSILRKSISGRHRPVRVADGPMTARCRFT